MRLANTLLKVADQRGYWDRRLNCSKNGLSTFLLFKKNVSYFNMLNGKAYEISGTCTCL